MGACSFAVMQVGRYKDASEAYREACIEAEEYYGHQEGYNGTISTTHGCYPLRKKHPQFGSKKFYDFINDETEEMAKRECKYIEVTGAALKRAKERSGYKGCKGIKAFYFFGWAAE